MRLLLGVLMFVATSMACASQDCMILGDSIAVGVSSILAKDQYLKCETIAKVGRPTSEVLSHAPMSIDARTVIISTGSNDAKIRPYQYSNLRNRIYGNVTWLLPAKHQDARAIINEIARTHGDRVIDLAALPLSDGIHPTRSTYQTVAKELRSDIRRPQVAKAAPILIINFALSSAGRTQ